MSNSETPTPPSEEQPIHADWPKMLEWIEKQAQESLKSRYVTADLLAKETQTTLTILLAGVGASAAYGAKLFEPGSSGPIVFASAIVCFYLIALSVALVISCMMFQSYPALHQDPKNLMHPTYSLDAVRQAEVENIGKRIAEAAMINQSRATRLNIFRIATALSPLIFVAAAMSALFVVAPTPAKPVDRTSSKPASASSGSSNLVLPSNAFK